MSFRDNLQHLRATRNLTQEQLAVLLGVSRQSVTKWESERAYPEMDKLLKLCSIFDCTLDELVQGNLTARPMSPASAACAAVPEDTCGYDTHMRSRAWHIALGVSSIILGVALATLLDGSSADDLLSVAGLFAGVFVGLALIIPTVVSHGAFMRAHPFVQDFYTPEERQSASRLLAWGVVCGVGCIFLGVLACALMETTYSHEQASGSIMIAFVAVAVGCFIYVGLMRSRVDLDSYNQEVAEALSENEIEAMPDKNRRDTMLASKRRSQKTEAVCGIIMLAATIVGLALLFIPGLHTPFFWLAWVFGGIACGIASIVVNSLGRL